MLGFEKIMSEGFLELLLSAMQEGSVQKRIQEIAAGQIQAKETQPENSQAEYELACLQKQITELKTIIARKDTMLEAGEEKASALALKYADLQKQMESLQAAAAEKENKLQADAEKVLFLEQEKQDLQNQVQDLTEKENRVSKKKKELLEQLHEMEKETQKAKKAAAPFGELQEIYQSYRRIAESDPKMSEIGISIRSPIDFLSTGCQKETFLALWEYMKIQAVEQDRSADPALLKVLAYLLDRFNTTMKNPLYQLAKDETGEYFDGDRHMRTNSSRRSSAPIQQTLLPGIENLSTQKMDKKSVVKL